jgi:hypothetical protein
MVSRMTDRSDHHDPRTLDSLALLIQRMMDAELLPDREGAALLAESDAAFRSLEAGDRAEARERLSRIAHRTKRLVRRGVLPPAEGGAVLQEVHQAVTALLGPPADGDSSPLLPGRSGISGVSDPG